MIKLDRIQRLFQEDWPEIVRRCESDPNLEEICEDLERLAEDIEQAEANKIFMSENLKADVIDSLEELVQEVMQRITRPETR